MLKYHRWRVVMAFPGHVSFTTLVSHCLDVDQAIRTAQRRNVGATALYVGQVLDHA